MFLSRVVALAVAVSTTACFSNTDVLRFDTTLRSQTHPDSIRLLAEEPQRPYRVVAIVSAMGSSGGFLGLFHKSARRNLVEAAARLGGDAVLLGAGSLTRVGTGGEYGGTALQISGKVIVFDREAARSN